MENAATSPASDSCCDCWSITLSIYSSLAHPPPELNSRSQPPGSIYRMRTILIFRQTLLPITETFVHAQAGALENFSPRYIGFQPTIPSLPVGKDPILLARTRSYLSRARKAF